MIADPDLAYLRLAVHDLQDYLQSPVIFWPLPSSPTSLGEPGLQQLTLGGVAMSLARVMAAGAGEGDTFRRSIDAARKDWHSSWTRKAAREFSSRTALWRRALIDLLDEPVGRKNAYPARVRLRVMLELLFAEMAPERPAEIEQLAELDGRLRAVTSPGEFVWEACFSPGFSQDRFWFLYCQFDAKSEQAG